MSKANEIYKKEVAKAICLSQQVLTYMLGDLKQLQILCFTHLNSQR